MAIIKSCPELTAAAIDAFNGAAFDPQKHGMQTSDKCAAFYVGRHLKSTGHQPPFGLRKSRGDTMHANGSLWSLKWQGSRTPIVNLAK